ncbi:hypothetical protein EYF80_061850 [Liparis tanakae]|uniref:Uncharacterized protein n=1 Tax=Liparis tanakae TaxID=230148 RepID=A0A4Z2EH51_9TELE|nr:hypothetical protein EYF80_061850 [Liparis tanakae]
MADVSDFVGDELWSPRRRTRQQSGAPLGGGHVWCFRGAHLGDGPADESAEGTPLSASPSPPPLMVPAADITADIMALMEDRNLKGGRGDSEVMNVGDEET